MQVGIQKAGAQRKTQPKADNLPGRAVAATVVAGTVWLVLYRLGIGGPELKVAVPALSYLLTFLVYSDQRVSRLDELLYQPNYNPRVLTEERRGTKKRWIYLILPSGKRMHEKRTEFGAA
jgi:hypothetical protein